jgi:hypothetical protein
MSNAVRALTAAVLASAAAVASAQSQSSAPPTTAPPTTAPPIHAGTKLAFPASLGGATLERSINYGAPPANNAGQGQSYYYATPKRLIINVQVFDGGRRVPPGSDNPTVTGQFTDEVNSAEQQFKFAGYTQFQKPSVPSACTYGSVTFRCITYSGVAGANQRLFSKLLLTGFRDHFLKIRIDWSQAHQQNAADAEAALQAFVPALVR